jgi:hypothetical protein
VSRASTAILLSVGVYLLCVSGSYARASDTLDSVGGSELVFTVPGASLGDLLSIDAVQSLARAGGAGFVSSTGPLAFPTYYDNTGTPPRAQGPVWSLGAIPALGAANRGAALGETDAKIRAVVARQAGSGPCVVMVAPRQPSPTMIGTKDELLPIVVASGPHCQQLFATKGTVRTITSDSTRRPGIVAAGDVPVTILDELHRTPRPVGAEIRFVDAPPPLHLYEKHLANRRMSVPVQTAAAIYVGLAGLLGVAVLYSRRRAPRWLRLVAAWAAMSVPALAVALLAAGRLPTLSYATVVPFLVVGTAAGTLAFDPLRRGDVLLVPAAIGAAVLVYFVVEAIFNWSAALTPFLGGSELDGGRFFGLPNVYVGLLLGASLYVAQRLALTPGVALIVAVGFFAGLPGIGANLGGALTLFSAAGMWLIVRAHERLGWGRSIAIAAAIVVVGMAAVFASHEFLTATPTHGTRFVEGAGRSVTGIWGTITHRLGVGFDLIARNPFALLPVLGVPACLYVVLRPTPSIRGSFERRPVWRGALLVILLGSVVAYAANDSGAAAVGLGFGLAIGGMLYVPLADEAGNMEAG